MDYYFLATVFLQTEPVGVPSFVPWAIGIVLLLLFWWGLNRNSIAQEQGAHDDGHEGDHEPATHSEPHTTHHDADAELAAEPVAMTQSKAVSLEEAPEPAAPAKPDDLKIVEGIGPKIEEILHEAGIHTFAELAAASVDQLEQIVREDAGIRVAFPDTWPEQARLAAAGKWDVLEALQDDLKGGRRA